MELRRHRTTAAGLLAAAIVLFGLLQQPFYAVTATGDVSRRLAVSVPTQPVSARRAARGFARPVVQIDSSPARRGKSAGIQGLYITACGGFFGVVDRWGNTLVEPRFSAIRPFAGGRAAVQSNGLWGFVDVEGRMAVPAVYDEVGDYSEGRAAVRQGDFYGYLDEQGEPAIPVRLPYGGKLYPFQNGHALYQHNGFFTYIDRQGELLTEPRYACTGRQDGFTAQGFAVVARWQGEALGYGVMDSSGCERVPARYDAVSISPEGYFVVEHGGRFGVLDENGQPLVPLVYGDGLSARRAAYGMGFGGKQGAAL